MANIHEGTRRLALFFGVAAALGGAFFSALILSAGPINAANLASAAGAPIVGFFLAYWIVRAVGWVVAGFSRSSPAS